MGLQRVPPTLVASDAHVHAALFDLGVLLIQNDVIFLEIRNVTSHRFYVKSILENSEAVKLPFCQFRGSEFG